MVLEVYVIIGSLVIFLTENNIPKSVNTDREITRGVPQGSILGPILFLIYINDISNSTELNLLSFADDTTIYCSETTLDENCEKATSELSKILDWLHANRLSLNINKTNFTIFFLLLFAVCTPHAEYYILFWRGVRGCLNNFSGCYCKIWKL